MLAESARVKLPPMNRLHVGTSGYAYKEWCGTFYPEKLPQKKMLEYYSRHFETVEINYTFYRLPSAKTLAEWVPQTPENFKFTLKANQKITHILRLRKTEQLVDAFLKGAEPLLAAGRCGPILLQLPPNFRADFVVLEEFLTSLPQREGIRWAMEFRHQSWFGSALLDLLRRRDVALCVAETEDERTPDEATAQFCYYRLRKVQYAEGELAAWRKRFNELTAAGREVFVYFKHEEEGTGPKLAKQLLELRA